MDLSEAIELIRETNEPLAIALSEIINQQDKITKSQATVMESLILHLLTPPGQPSVIDLNFLVKMLKDN